MNKKWHLLDTVIEPGREQGNVYDRQQKWRGGGAFTLLELIVVVGIIGVLAALLLPAINRSVGQSRSLACLKNLRELQLCWLMYADDHEGELPPNNYVYYNDTKTSKARNESWCPGNARTDADTQNIERGVLFLYNEQTKIYHCPSDRSTIEDEEGNPLPQLRIRSYNMSASVNCKLTENRIPYYRTYGEINKPTPDKFFVFIDTHEDSIMDAHFGLCQPSSQYGAYWFDLPADRHDQGANLSFADGHVEHWRWAWPKRVKYAPQPYANAQDLKDMRRLQAAMKPME